MCTPLHQYEVALKHMDVSTTVIFSRRILAYCILLCCTNSVDLPSVRRTSVRLNYILLQARAVVRTVTLSISI